MGFLSRIGQKRENERREAWEAAMVKLVKAVSERITDDAEHKCTGEIIGFADDDSLVPGFLALSERKMVWAYADKMEVQRLDVRDGFRWSYMEELSSEGRTTLMIFGKKDPFNLIMFPPDSALLHCIQAEGEDQHS